jgi:tetratricopeptide (TPR) repeat protein
LLEVPGGAVLGALTEQGRTDDLFELQDHLVRRIVDALQLNLTRNDNRALHQAAPEATGAYELYLRANAIAQGWKNLPAARDLYRECLARDETYAPAWARLGRCYRLLAKYEGDPKKQISLAEEAFQRALALQPDLDLAHSLYAPLEADLGRPREAMARLLGCVKRQPNSADLAAGLVYVCRLCGLLEESLWFHQEVRRLDPLLPTSVTHTYFQSCGFARSLEASSGDIGYIDAAALAVLGRTHEAIERTGGRLAAGGLPPLARLYIESLHELLQGRARDGSALVAQALRDFLLGPEETMYFIRHLAYARENDAAFLHLDRAVEAGWGNAGWLEQDPWFGPLRGDARLSSALDRIRGNQQRARESFRSARSAS